MSAPRERNERSERVSVAYFPGHESEEGDARVKGSAFLFVRDLPISIMPYRNGEESDFAVTLEPANEDVAAWVMKRLDVSGHRAWSLEDALSDFVREVVGSLAYLGEVYFEIVGPTGARDQDALPEMQLVRLPPGRVLKAANKYVQLVPSYAQAELGMRYVVIPAAQVWRLRLPRALGRPRQHRQMLRRLAEVSDVIPAFAQSPTLGSEVAGYDLRAFRFATDAEVENLTKRWGSIPSLQRIDGTTEFYFFERTLEFRFSEALVREEIIREVNRLLRRLGVQSQLRVGGLPTSTRIASLIRDLRTGTIDFSRAMAESRVP